MKKESCIEIIFVLLFLLLLVSSFFVAPSLALETRSTILTGEGTLGIGESYELYQGYSVEMIEPASSGSKVIIRITLDGKTVEEDSFISEDVVYNFTREYDDEDFIVLAITLLDVDTDDLTANLRVTQYIDPSRPTTGFLITDQDEKIEPGTHLYFKQGYSLNIENFGTNSAILGLYKNNIMVKEHKMEENDLFNYSLTSNGKDHTIITFNIKGLFKSNTRNVVFIEHLYQFEEPIDANSVESVTSTENNTNYGNSNITVSVQVSSNDGGDTIYENKSINLTYHLSGSDSFDSASVTLDGNIIDELTAPQPGTHSIILESLSAGSHIIEVSAISGDKGRITNKTKIYVRKNLAENLLIPKSNLTSASIVLAATTLLLIIWAAIRRRRQDD